MLPIEGWGMDGYIELNPAELNGNRDAAIAFAAAIAADEWEETFADRDEPDEDIYNNWIKNFRKKGFDFMNIFFKTW